jgi:large subunit ribosomal protein L13
MTNAPKVNTIKRTWHLIDLKGQTLGRISTKMASLLMGKGKTYFSANLDCGDYIVAINAAKIKVTGHKVTDKIYRHHTGFPDGFKEYDFNHLLAVDARQIIMKSVGGMLPKNKLRDPRLKRLKVFVNNDHPYQHKFELKESNAS